MLSAVFSWPKQLATGSRLIMQRGFLNSSDGIFGAAGRKRKSPAAASSASSGPGPVSGADKKDAGAGPDGQGGASSSSGADGQRGASSSGADGQGGFGPYTKEQVQHFVLQLKHMDMLGIDTYVTDNGAIFGREELRDIIKRFDR